MFIYGNICLQTDKFIFVNGDFNCQDGNIFCNLPYWMYGYIIA